MRPLVALAVALVLPACVCARLYATDWPEPVETHRVTTADGWSLDLRHVKASGGRARPRPVIVLHGIVTNGRNCDLDEQHSLARWLSAQGFDVWVPSLRGTGDSEKRSLFGAAGDEDFDSYATRDVPALIAYVQRQTGSSKVDFVGHSMGGLALYAHLALGGGGVGRAVTLGSPVRLRWSGRVEDTVRTLSPLARYASWVPISATIRSTLPVQATTDGPLEKMLISYENTTPETWRRFLAVGVDDLPRGLAAQFARWLSQDRFDSRDGTVDYLAGLSKVTVPVLVVAGKIDGIAPPWAVRPAFDALGGEKRWLLLSEANGQGADYNHMDMLLGEHAAADLWGRVATFLDR